MPLNILQSHYDQIYEEIAIRLFQIVYKLYKHFFGGDIVSLLVPEKAQSATIIRESVITLSITRYAAWIPATSLMPFGKTLIYICHTRPRWCKWVPVGIHSLNAWAPYQGSHANLIKCSSIQGISSYRYSVPIYITWVECCKCRLMSCQRTLVKWLGFEPSILRSTVRD